MKRADLTGALLDTERERGWRCTHIHAEIGSLSPILVTAARMGRMALP